jgi:hypothetical protein
VNEAYTSQTCPNCGERYKPKGRAYCCPACGFQSHRDAVGAANIRSVCLRGKPRQSPPGRIKYRRPFIIWRRSRVDIAHVARPTSREAAGLKAQQSVTKKIFLCLNLLFVFNSAIEKLFPTSGFINWIAKKFTNRVIDYQKALQ